MVGSTNSLPLVLCLCWIYENKRSNRRQTQTVVQSSSSRKSIFTLLKVGPKNDLKMDHK